MREEEARYEAIQLTKRVPKLGPVLMNLRTEGKSWAMALLTLLDMIKEGEQKPE